MVPEQVTLVRSSWQRLAPVHVQVIWLFYSRLFEIAPSVQGYLLHELDAQPARLAALIDAVLTRLDHPESLSDPLRASGRRHAGSGISDEDYETVAEAFLWSLRQALEARFTPALHEAWASAYSTLAGLMKEGAGETRPPRGGRLRNLFGLRRAG